jgi:hypothetical protein
MAELSDGFHSVTPGPDGETGGLIRQLELTDWWEGLPESRRGKLRHWSLKSGISSQLGTPVDRGEVTSTTMTAHRLLRTMAEWADAKDEFGILRAIVEELEQRATTSQEYAHVGSALSKLVYHYAHAGPETDFIAACKRHIAMAPKMIEHYRDRHHTPSHTGYLALYDYYRESGDREKARNLCKRGKDEWPFIDWERLLQGLDS